MKTITEFAGIQIKNVFQLKQTLVNSGKTPEEVAPAIGELLKIENDKLTHLMNALDSVGSKLADLKRVLVFGLAEGEKPPQGAVQNGEAFYMPEYYPPLAKPSDRNEKGRHKMGKGKKGDGKRRPPRRDDRRDHGSSKGTGPGTGPRPIPNKGPVSTT